MMRLTLPVAQAYYVISLGTLKGIEERWLLRHLLQEAVAKGKTSFSPWEKVRMRAINQMLTLLITPHPNPLPRGEGAFTTEMARVTGA